MIDMAQRRIHMVDAQLLTNRIIDDPLIQAFLDIPREMFVPDMLRGVAYVDEDIAIGEGRFLLEPMILARLIQTAGVKPTDTILDLGCGSGYAAVILSRLGRSVVAVEEKPALAAMARRNLDALGVGNVDVIESPLVTGYAGRAPYDVILMAGAVPEIPAIVAGQLAEGGRLVTVLRAPGRVGQGVLMDKVRGVLSKRALFDAATPVFPRTCSQTPLRSLAAAGFGNLKLHRHLLRLCHSVTPIVFASSQLPVNLLPLFS